MSRRLALLVLLAVPSFWTGVAAAREGPGLHLDPRLLPATRQGECVVRRVTGPGGAYRWDRVECDNHGWSGFDSWDYGARLDVQTAPRGGPAGDRYSYGDRYDPDWGPGYRPYRVAGVDEDGYLVWPGKQP
jgi:hypothetical protein